MCETHPVCGLTAGQGRSLLAVTGSSSPGERLANVPPHGLSRSIYSINFVPEGKINDDKKNRMLTNSKKRKNGQR